MNSLIAGILFAHLSAQGGFALERQEPQSARPVPVRVKPHNKTLTISVRSDTYTISLDTLVLGQRIDSSRTLAAAQVAGELFVLLEVQGPSRAPASAMGYCGSGWEQSLVWAGLARNRPPRITVVPYESCLANVGEGGGGPAPFRISPDSLWGEWDHFNHKVHVHLLYLLARPDRGPQLTETPLPP